MPLKYNDSLKKNAQFLRKNMTKEERHLWYDFLKDLPITVQRQKMIGSYIADFYCHKLSIVIEIDGGQHYTEEEMEYDKRRTEYLNSVGVKVVRYTNDDINKNFDGVCNDILQRLGLLNYGVYKQKPSPMGAFRCKGVKVFCRA